MVGLSHRWLVAAASLIITIGVLVVLVMVGSSNYWVQAFVAVAWLIITIVYPVVLVKRALKENPKHSRAWLGIILSLIAIILWIILMSILFMS